MLDIIAEIKAEAERELLLAQAKLEVATSIEKRFLVKAEQEVAADEPCENPETPSYVEEPVSEFAQI